MKHYINVVCLLVIGDPDELTFISWLQISFDFFQVQTSMDGICVALRELLPFVQFEKPEDHRWRSVTLKKKLQASTCNFTKGVSPLWVFFTFLNCTDDTKSPKASHLFHAQ